MSTPENKTNSSADSRPCRPVAGYERVREILQSRDKSWTWLANQTGIRKGRWSQWARGKGGIPWDAIQRIADAFEMPVGSLMGGGSAGESALQADHSVLAAYAFDDLGLTLGQAMQMLRAARNRPSARAEAAIPVAIIDQSDHDRRIARQASPLGVQPKGKGKRANR